jgi:hypothetical protein
MASLTLSGGQRNGLRVSVASGKQNHHSIISAEDLSVEDVVENIFEGPDVICSGDRDGLPLEIVVTSRIVVDIHVRVRQSR